MIESFDDLDAEEINKIETKEEYLSFIQDKLGFKFDDYKQYLNKYVQEKSNYLSKEFVNIAPYNKYANLLEEEDQIKSFLETEVCKDENWEINYLREISFKDKPTLKLEFTNKATGSCEVFAGFVYVAFNGKLLHAFARGEK